MRSPSSYNFLKKFGPKNTIFVCVWVGKFLGTSLELERIWGGKTIFIKFGPFSALFVQSRPKFGRRFGQAAPLFIRPFLTYVAEQSASWQSCCKRAAVRTRGKNAAGLSLGATIGPYTTLTDMQDPRKGWTKNSKQIVLKGQNIEKISSHSNQWYLHWNVWRNIYRSFLRTKMPRTQNRCSKRRQYTVIQKINICTCCSHSLFYRV
jgi:hypothetical protein